MTASAGKHVRELTDALAAFATGPDRSREAVDRLLPLLADVRGLPWLDELSYAAGKYAPDDAEVGEAAMVSLVTLALADWARQKRWRSTVPPDAKGLRKRWLDESGRARAEAVAGLLATPAINDLAFGVYQGRLDFRGFVDPGDKYRERQAGNLLDVDFSGATFPQVSFSRASIRNCRFDGAAFRELHVWGSELADSTFRGADLSHAMFWGAKEQEGRTKRPASPTTVVRVDFAAANLGAASARQFARFEDCDFSDAWLLDAEFQCDLVRCRFAGRVYGLMLWGQDTDYRDRQVTWRPVLVQDVDLQSADLELVGIRRLDLNALKLPETPDLRIVNDWPCVHGKIEAAIAKMAPAEASFSTRFALSHKPEWAVPPLYGHVVEVAYLRREDTAAGFQSFLKLLDRAEEACGHENRPAAASFARSP